MNAIRLLRPAVLVAATAMLCVPAVAQGTPPTPQTPAALAPTQTEDGGLPAPMQGRQGFSAESAGSPVAGLPPTRTNVELVGKVELTQPFGDVRPEQIADVSAKGDFAYLNSWQSPVARPGAPAGSCERGGVFVVDISDPANPRQVTFIPSSLGSYPGEGSQVISINTPAFQGDVLTINNEACADTPADGDATTRKGGISLIDVTNPRAPVKLADGVGDVTPSGAIPGVKDSPVHLSHSAFSWQVDGDPSTNADNKAYTVFVDNEEQGGEDVDILDITNPRAPVFINEFSLNAPAGGSSGFGDNVLLHDMVVENIGGRYIMLASYWDGGYVRLDITDPLAPVVLAESDFLVNDPLFPAFSPPEGNAHQAEFSHDRQLVVAADEDFSPYRLVTDINGVSRDFGFGVAVTAAGAFRPELFPDVGEPIAGDTRFIGDGCTAPVPAPLPGETVAVAERGTCDFDVKAGNAQAAGYTAILIFNNVLGAAPRCEATNLNMIFDGTPAVTIKALLIPRAIGFEIIDAFDPATYTCTMNDPASTPTPAPNRAGVPVDFSARFDGWGYMHLYDANTMQELDAWAVDEAMDERFALNFGDLSVHETANDPETNLAYVSYYRAGFRVLRFSQAGGLEEVGRFIDTRGNNLWGVHQMTADDGSRLILSSDRDYGLYIFRYTGPGAIGPRQPPGPAAGRCANAQAGTASADRMTGHQPRRSPRRRRRP